MYLSKFSDYGLRVLAFLALDPDRQVTIEEVSRQFNMPRNHVMKVVQALSANGFVIAKPGKKGGIRLPENGLALSIGLVVRRMERNLEIIDCEEPFCPISGACGMKTVLDEARDAFLAVLDRYSLGAVLGNAEVLRSLVGIVLPPPGQPLPEPAESH